jgi:glycine cleavage system H protein
MKLLPLDLKYTKTHEWIRKEPDGYITIGITEHAQELLGDIVFVDHREIGEQVSAGEDIAVAESVKAVSEVYAPVSGEVVAFNDRLNDAPEHINIDAFGDGWLVRMNPSDVAEFQELMNAEEYESFLQEA